LGVQVPWSESANKHGRTMIGGRSQALFSPQRRSAKPSRATTLGYGVAEAHGASAAAATPLIGLLLFFRPSSLA
jgi:hypothetical protein